MLLGRLSPHDNVDDCFLLFPMDTHRRYTYILLDAVALRIKFLIRDLKLPFSYVRIFFVCQPSNNTRVRSFRPYLLFGVIAWVFHAVFCWLSRRVVVAFARWGVGDRRILPGRTRELSNTRLEGGRSLQSANVSGEAGWFPNGTEADNPCVLACRGRVVL